MPLAGRTAWAKGGGQWEPSGGPHCLKPRRRGEGRSPFPPAGTMQTPCQTRLEHVPPLSLIVVAPLFVLRAWVFLLLLKRWMYVPVRPVLFVVSGPEG